MKVIYSNLKEIKKPEKVEVREVIQEAKASTKPRFNEHYNYEITCYGVGDIYCSINALENMAIERKCTLSLYALNERHQDRFRNIFSSLRTTHINVKYSKDTDSHIERFSAFGPFNTWVGEWLTMWGNTQRFGQKCMVEYCDEVKQIENKIGVSFTVVSNPEKTPNRASIENIIDSAINRGSVFYYGYRGDISDKWIYDKYKGDVTFEPYNLVNTIKSVRECSEFIGADSGMAWIATFGKVNTRIVVGKTYGKNLPKAFADIDWVTVGWERL